MKIVESVFEIAYLLFAIATGMALLRRSREKPACFLPGLASLVLGCGDAFHLVPRIMNTFAAGDWTAAMGFGKAVTSVTMTVFYVLLELYRRERYRVKGETGLWKYMIVLAAARIALCVIPDNGWFTADPPLFWGILRNIPFVAMGTLTVMLWKRYARRDPVYRHLWVAAALSFLFYIPVVLWAQAVPLIGMLMLPKTVMYVWMLVMFLKATKERN